MRIDRNTLRPIEGISEDDICRFAPDTWKLH
jgi:hypothetical protein